MAINEKGNHRERYVLVHYEWKLLFVIHVLIMKADDISKFISESFL